MRTQFIAGNWKMNLDRAAARALVGALTSELKSLGDIEIGVFPPFTLIPAAAEAARGTGLVVGGQDCHAQPGGAFTGEVSAPMLRDAGATHVILGHSERRMYRAETDAQIADKLRAALDAGLTPILCVGETLDERTHGRTLDVIGRQIAGALAPFSAAALSGLVVAYEPVWAIGTGQTATPAQAVEVHAALRALTAERFDVEFATALRILYGGSVKADNAAELLHEDQIDGALVGGASLDARSFLGIARAGAAARPRGNRRT